MKLSKSDWRNVFKAISEQLKRDDDGSHAQLRAARSEITDACQQAGSQEEVEIVRPIEWFAELYWSLEWRPRMFDAAVTASLFDVHGGW